MSDADNVIEFPTRQIGYTVCARVGCEAKIPIRKEAQGWGPDVRCPECGLTFRFLI